MTIKKKKPLSPHLTIYKPQISTVLSISHRATGIFNFLGMLCFLWWIVFLAYANYPFQECFVYSVFQTTFGKLILVAWSFSLFLHMCTGIRHLFWDLGYGFDLKVMNITGWVAVLMALMLTALTWSIYFNMVY